MFLPKQSKHYLTLLFTDQALVAAKLNAKGDRLQNLAEFPLPTGLIIDGEITQEKKLAQFLKETKAKIALKDRLVVVGLSEARASTHSLTLPVVEPQEIDSAVRFEADSFLPFPYKDEYLDWMLIEKTSQNKARILVSAVPKRIINSYTQCLASASWQPIAFETTSLSLLRLLPAEGKRIGFAAEVGKTVVVLILGLKGNIEACSVIKKDDDLIATIKKMNEFYFAPEKDGQTPQKIYLCGANVNQDLLNNIKQNLGLEPIILKKPLAGLPENQQVRLSILISLAQKEVAPPADEKTINILPETLLEQYQSEQEKKRKKLVVGLITLLLILLNTFSWLTFWQLKNQTEEGQKLASHLPYQESQLQDWSTKATLINQQAQQNKIIGQILESILAFSQPKINLSGFSYQPVTKQITLTGNAVSRNDLVALKTNLEKNTLFSQVLVPLSALQQEENIEFKIMLTIVK